MILYFIRVKKSFNRTKVYENIKLNIPNFRENNPIRMVMIYFWMSYILLGIWIITETNIGVVRFPTFQPGEGKWLKDKKRTEM